MTNSDVSEVCRNLLNRHIMIVGHWKDERSNQLVVQNFKRDGASFIPVFSDEANFRNEIIGSGFEDDGISIDCRLFVSLLHGDEVLILNPGSHHPLELRKADFI
ncbi:MAG: SseB family protein [Phycisphaeraceae bacterium]|nr:SseB family protein [Phycisphaeraceae bacterium]